MVIMRIETSLALEKAEPVKSKKNRRDQEDRRKMEKSLTCCGP
jgi:hypothetical protein